MSRNVSSPSKQKEATTNSTAAARMSKEAFHAQEIAAKVEANEAHGVKKPAPGVLALKIQEGKKSTRRPPKTSPSLKPAPIPPTPTKSFASAVAANKIPRPVPAQNTTHGPPVPAAIKMAPSVPYRSTASAWNGNKAQPAAPSYSRPALGANPSPTPTPVKISVVRPVPTQKKKDNGWKTVPERKGKNTVDKPAAKAGVENQFAVLDTQKPTEKASQPAGLKKNNKAAESTKMPERKMTKTEKQKNSSASPPSKSTNKLGASSEKDTKLSPRSTSSSSAPGSPLGSGSVREATTGDNTVAASKSTSTTLASTAQTPVAPLTDQPKKHKRKSGAQRKKAKKAQGKAAALVAAAAAPAPSQSDTTASISPLQPSKTRTEEIQEATKFKAKESIGTRKVTITHRRAQAKQVSAGERPTAESTQHKGYKLSQEEISENILTLYPQPDCDKEKFIFKAPAIRAPAASFGAKDDAAPAASSPKTPNEKPISRREVDAPRKIVAIKQDPIEDVDQSLNEEDANTTDYSFNPFEFAPSLPTRKTSPLGKRTAPPSTPSHDGPKMKFPHSVEFTFSSSPANKSHPSPTLDESVHASTDALHKVRPTPSEDNTLFVQFDTEFGKPASSFISVDTATMLLFSTKVTTPKPTGDKCTSKRTTDPTSATFKYGDDFLTINLANLLQWTARDFSNTISHRLLQWAVSAAIILRSVGEYLDFPSLAGGVAPWLEAYNLPTPTVAHLLDKLQLRRTSMRTVKHRSKKASNDYAIEPTFGSVTTSTSLAEGKIAVEERNAANKHEFVAAMLPSFSNEPDSGVRYHTAASVWGVEGVGIKKEHVLPLSLPVMEVTAEQEIVYAPSYSADALLHDDLDEPLDEELISEELIAPSEVIVADDEAALEIVAINDTLSTTLNAPAGLGTPFGDTLAPFTAEELARPATSSSKESSEDTATGGPASSATSAPLSPLSSLDYDYIEPEFNFDPANFLSKEDQDQNKAEPEAPEKETIPQPLAADLSHTHIGTVCAFDFLRELRSHEVEGKEVVTKIDLVANFLLFAAEDRRRAGYGPVVGATDAAAVLKNAGYQVKVKIGTIKLEQLLGLVEFDNGSAAPLRNIYHAFLKASKMDAEQMKDTRLARLGRELGYM